MNYSELFSINKKGLHLLMISLTVVVCSVQGMGIKKMTFLDAIGKGNLLAVNKGIASGAATKCYGDDQVTGLHIAAAYENCVIMKRLLDAGADIDARTKNGGTPLLFAVESDACQAARLLVSKGANVNMADSSGQVLPLDRAVQKNNYAMVDILINAGADVNSATQEGITPLYTASEYGFLPIVQRLLSVGADQKKTTCGFTPLHVAADEGHVEIVRTLLESGACVDMRCNNGFTALYYAVQKQNIEICKLLLQAKAQVNVQNNVGSTPLHMAVIKKDNELAQLLVDYGADPSIPNIIEQTPLWLAQKNKIDSMVDLFTTAISQKAVRESVGLEIEGDYRSQAKFSSFIPAGPLVSSSAPIEAPINGPAQLDVNKTNSLGRTALHIAAELGHDLSVVKLLEMGAKVSLTDNNGRTPLHEAARMGYDSVVKCLLGASADANIKDKEGKLPINLAGANGHASTVKILLAAAAQKKASPSAAEAAAGSQ